MSQHSLYSPSASSRWLKCPGSLNLTEIMNASGQLKNETSVQAEKGTSAHHVLEHMVLNDLKDASQAIDALGLIGVGLEPKLLDESFAALKGLYEEFGTPQVERRVSYRGFEDAFGTVDYIFENNTNIHIVDFKYGYYPVEAAKNTQMLFYGLMYLSEFGSYKPLTLSIIQPKISKRLTSWSPNKAQVLEFKESVDGALKQVKRKEGEINPGSHCRFCPVKIACPKG